MGGVCRTLLANALLDGVVTVVMSAVQRRMALNASQSVI